MKNNYNTRSVSGTTTNKARGFAKAMSLIIGIFLSILSSNTFAQTGAALSFTGNEWVSLNTSMGNFGTGNFTIETWYNTSSNNNQCIISTRNTA